MNLLMRLVKFPLPPTFTFPPHSLYLSVCLLRYSAQTAQGRADSPGCFTQRLCFCTRAQKEVGLRVTQGLDAGLAPRELVPLLDESSMAAPLSLDSSLMQSSRLTLTISIVLELQRCYYAPFAGPCVIETNRSMRWHTIWIFTTCHLNPFKRFQLILSYALTLLRHLQRRYI